jgi:CubicO group peptidase (beta-lactamase class C family)
MVAEISEEELPVHGVVIVRHGKVVFEAYFPPFSEQDKHIIYSATKSVTAMLTGAAIADGLIAGDTQPVAELLPAYRELLSTQDIGELSLQVKHLLTMTAGFDWSDGPYGVAASGDFSRLLGASDGVAYILNKSRTAVPGSRYNYNSGCSHLLAAIIQEATGRTVLDYAKERLFAPIGISDVAWSEYEGIANGGSELFLRPRDMARLGYLVLRRGRWEGRQVLLEEWVDKMTAPMLSTNVEQLGEMYGYGWYTKELGGQTVWSAEGLGGNGIYVVPKLDLVVVFTGGLVGRDMMAPYHYIEQILLEVVGSKEPLLRTASVPWARGEAESRKKHWPGRAPMTTSSEVMDAVSGEVFAVETEDNLLGITKLGFDFAAAESGRMKIVYTGTGKDADWGVDVVFRTDDLVEQTKQIELEFGLDGAGRTTTVQHDEVGTVPVMAEGRWDSGCRLALEVVTGWAIPQAWTIDFCMEGTASLEIHSPFYDTTVTGSLVSGR